MLFCLICCSSVILLWTFFQGAIPLLKHAHLWVIGFPVDFLPGGVTYLYIKSVLLKEKKIMKQNFLHFIPAGLHFIELIPFHILPVKAKQNSLTLYLLHPERVSDHSAFMLPMDVHVFLKNALWCFYILLMLRLLIVFQRKNPLWIKRNAHVWFWITRLTAFHLIAFLIFLCGVIFFNNYNREYSVLHPVFFILTCIIFLMFKPKVLYGLSYLNNYNSDLMTLKEEEEVLSKTFELSSAKSKEYKEKIELWIQNEKAFLAKNYLLKDMSKDLDIPVHHLSYVINKEFGTNYTSLINNCRIEYIIRNRYDPAWSQFSLEGIGNEVGFNSRNTFFKAFKIATGETPSEYFRKKENNIECPSSISDNFIYREKINKAKD